MNRDDLAHVLRIATEGWPSLPMSPSLTEVWAQALAGLDYDAVVSILRQFIATEKFRPPVGELIEAAGPQPFELLEEARVAIGRFGQYREDEAFAAISGAARIAVEEFGGWRAWCLAFDDPRTRERFLHCAQSAIRIAAVDGIFGRALRMRRDLIGAPTAIGELLPAVIPQLGAQSVRAIKQSRVKPV